MKKKLKPKLNEYLSVSQVAELVGFTPDHIRKLIANGTIKAEKVGNSWIIAKEDISDLERQRLPRKKGLQPNG